ncbi:hypothetical protein [Streptantibioticus ferralitis]|uniref:Uncharacterized protein n=1 Tax=Streptantibioticus ferralitis TaxID=236510 RepID=A0ABT5YVL4_9ACTN|nr:hypothetical protein [Streptantibioticus ferralitis]MDF2254865.1 hypothetical protein [Streptantibioticus ferralitis]
MTQSAGEVVGIRAGDGQIGGGGGAMHRVGTEQGQDERRVVARRVRPHQVEDRAEDGFAAGVEEVVAAADGAFCGNEDVGARGGEGGDLAAGDLAADQ